MSIKKITSIFAEEMKLKYYLGMEKML